VVPNIHPSACCCVVHSEMDELKEKLDVEIEQKESLARVCRLLHHCNLYSSLKQSHHFFCVVDWNVNGE
jgi:hypothetical protein